MIFHIQQSEILDILELNYPQFTWKVEYENRMMNILCQKSVNDKKHMIHYRFEPLERLSLNHIQSICDGIIRKFDLEAMSSHEIKINL